MADNVEVTAGSGTTIATDQVGSDHYQRIKLTDGTADSSTVIAAGGGVEANALRVTIANDSTGAVSVDDGGGAITVDGTVTAELSATDNAVIDAIQTATEASQTALETIDDTVATISSTDVLRVAIFDDSDAQITTFGGGTEYTEDAATADPIVGKATVMERDDALSALTPIEGDWAAMRCSAEGALWTQDANSDAILADTANMDTNLGTVAGAVSGSEMQVDVVAALPAGDNNIGNVDIASSVSLDVSAATVTVDATGQGDVPVTLDGEEITANLGATDNAVLDAIQAAVELLDNSVDGNYLNVNSNIAGTDVAAGEGTISAQTQRVTIATDDDSVAHLATIAGDTTSLDGKVTACNTGAVTVSTRSITKAVSSITDWTAVAQNAVGESGAIDVSSKLEAQVHIQAFLDSTTAHTGTEFIIQVSSNSSGDEDWQDFTRFTGLVGTANSEAITNNPLAAASTTITVASTAGLYGTAPMCHWIAIEDGTLVNSELIFQTGFTADTSITCLDGTTNGHVQNTLMYDIANVWTINLPIGAYRARVVVNNTYDADGSTLNYKVRLVTAV